MSDSHNPWVPGFLAEFQKPNKLDDVVLVINDVDDPIRRPCQPEQFCSIRRTGFMEPAKRIRRIAEEVNDIVL
jgi:hypothetical protein